MAVTLSQIRVEAALDADKYVAGARAKAASDQQMVESGNKLGVSLDQTERRLGQSGTAAEKLARSIDPAYQAQKRLESGSATLQRALDAGTISAQRHAELLALLEKRYASTGVANDNLVTASNRTANSYKALGNAARLSFVDQEILRAGLVNTIQSLASGAGAARTFETQLFQTLPALGGVTRALGLTSAALLPIGTAIAAATIATVGFVAALTRLSNTEENIRRFNLELNALGTSGQTSGAALQKAFEQIRDSGTSAAEALMAIQAIARNPLINPARAVEFVSLARDISAVTGEKLPEAQAKLTAALEGGTEGIIKYGFSLNALSADQARNIRQSGDLNIAVRAIEDRFGGKFQESLSATARASESITAAWNKLLDTFANTAPIKAIRDAIVSALDGLAKLPDAAGKAWQSLKDTFYGPRAEAQIPPEGIQGASQAEATVLAQIRQRESGGAYDIFHANRQQVGSLADVERLSGQSHAFGAYGFQPGTYREQATALGFDPQNISRANQDAAALQLLRARGPNSTASWAASAPPGGYSTAGLTISGQPAGLPSAQQVDLTNKQAEAYDKLNEALSRTGASAKAAEAYNRSLESTQNESIDITTREKLARDAARQAFVEAAIELDKEAQAATRATAANLSVADAFITSEAAGFRAAAAAQAAEEIYSKFGSTQDRTAEIASRASQILEEQASAAIRSGEQQARAFDRTVQANRALAEASVRGAAAVRDAEIVNQAAVQTQDAYAKALASGNPALVARAEALQKQAEAQLRANAAAQATVQVNLQAEQNKNQTELIAAQVSLQGQSSSEIQKQVLLLHTKQDLETRFKDASDEAKQNLLAQTTALADANIKLEEARAAQARLDEEWRSIADTISNTVGSAIDDLLSGKKIDDWGDRFKKALSSIASTIIQTELIKPLIGSGLSALGATNAAQQYGTLGQSGGILSSILGIGKVAGAANDLASSATGGSGLFGGISSSINSFGASALGLANPALQGPTITGAALSETGALGGLSLGGLLGPIGAIASVGIPLISSLVGNKKPSNNAGGVLYDLSSGQVSDPQGGGANLGVAQQITTSLAKFEQDLARLLPGATLPGGQVSVAKGDLTGITTEYSGQLGNIKASFASAQDAVTQFSVAIAQNLTGVSDTVKRVLSTITDPSQIQAALAFAKSYDEVETAYDNLFQTIGVDSVRRIGPFEDILNKLNDQLDTLTKAAVGFGLSLDPINAGYEAAKSRLADDFNKTISQLTLELTDPAQAAIEAERKAGETRVQDAKAVGADLVAVDAYNAATLKKLADEKAKAAEDAANAEAKAAADAAKAAADSQTKLDDFNKTISQLTLELTDPAQAAIEAERKAGETRVREAKAVGADLVAVDAYNAAKLEKITEETAKATAKAAADAQAKLLEFQKSISTTFDAIIGAVEQLTGPFERAAISLADNFANLTEQATAAGYATDGIGSAAVDAQKRLARDFNVNITALAKSISDPVQAAIDIENAAGQQRVRDATIVNGDLDAVSKYNVASLQKVTEAAKSAVNTLASAQQIAATAASSLSASISNVLGTGKGQYAQALDTLTQQLTALITAAEQVDPLADLTAIVTAFGGSLTDLRNAFDENIRSLSLGLTDPYQQALNVELDAGRRRVAEAQALSADLAAVDEYNRQSLLAVAKAAATATDAIATAAGFNRDIAQQLLAIQDPVAAALQAELDAGEKRVAAAQQVGADLARVDELNRLKLLQVVDTTEGATDALDKFTGRLQSLEGALSQLTSGPLSGLTPAQSVTASSANFDRLLAQVQAGNTDLIPDLAAAGTQAVQTSQSVYGNAKQTADLRARVTKALEDVASQTGREAALAAQGVTITASNQAQVKASLQAQATSARRIADYAAAQADAEFKRTGVENQALRDQANASNAIASQLEAQIVAVTAQTGVQNQIVSSLQQQLGTQAAAARAIADQLQRQADIEFARTGIRENVYQLEANGARQIAYFLDLQANAQNISASSLNAQAAQLQAQANTEAARTGVVNNVYQQQADFSRALAYLLSLQVNGQVYSVDQLNQQAAQLQVQANIEAAKTGVINNVYQQQADAARNLAGLLAQSGASQTDQVNFLQLAARQARSIADTLQAQADADYQRTGVKNTLLQDEANAARQIGVNLDKQATSQGQLSQTDASRVQLAIALLQQDAAVAARTAQQNAGQVPVAVANVGTPEQQAAYLAAVQQQASGVAARVAAEQQAAQQGEAARAAADAQRQQQDADAQANLGLIVRQQEANQRLQQFIGGDREIGVMLAQLVRIGTVIQDYYSQPYLARGWLGYAVNFVQGWMASEQFSLSDMLSAQGFATGTGSTPPGWIRVGERGPELIHQPGGATILPYGVMPPVAANDDIVAELRRLQEMFIALVRQMQGGQAVASRDAKMIASETAAIGRKIGMGAPERRNVA